MRFTDPRDPMNNPILAAAMGSSVSTDNPGHKAKGWGNPSGSSTYLAPGSGGDNPTDSTPAPAASPAATNNLSHFRQLTPDEAVVLGKQPIGEAAYGSQLYAKKQMIESPTATHDSLRGFVERANAVSRVIPINPPKEGIYIVSRDELPRAGGVAAPKSEPAYNSMHPYLIAPEGFRDADIWNHISAYSKYGAGANTPRMASHVPTDYRKELVSYPLFTGASMVSRGLTSGLEWGVDILPLPALVKETAKGFGGIFTGLPEYFASGVSGIELAAREPMLFKTKIVPAIVSFGGSVLEQAKERPFYTAGQVVGIVAMARGVGKGRAPTKLLGAPKTEILKLPERQLLSQPPKGMEGLQLFKLPESTKVFKPTVIESVKNIQTRPTIPEQYKIALEKGAAPFAERGVMAIRFGSKGYRPTGMAKPENIFTGSSLKQFVKEEKAVSYIPTFERAKAEPKVIRKLQIITAERTSVLPSLRTLQAVKTIPRTTLRIMVLPSLRTLQVVKTTPRTVLQTSLRSKVFTKIATHTDILTATRQRVAIRSAIQTKTLPVTRTQILTKTLIKTAVEPSISTRINVIALPEIQIKPLVRTATQTHLKTAIKTQTEVMTDIKKMTKQKSKLDIVAPLRIKKKKYRFFGKFPEISRVASPKQVFKGFKIRKLF